jgi:hypothetical protein
MMRPQFLARQKCRENHQEKWPEIGDQADLDRRRVSDRGEIDEVVAKKTGNAQCPEPPILMPERGECGRAEDPRCSAEDPANKKTHGCKLKGRNAAGRCRKQCQKCPHQNCREADQRCSSA